MGYYCTVPQCTSLAGKTKNVKFHRFPRDVSMADKWNIILRRGKPYTKYSKVCSLHFTQADYNVTTMGQWKTLSKDAVPSQNLPKLNPDGTVMVIRKSRTVKYREAKKEDSDKESKWAMMTSKAPPSLLAPDTPCGSQEIHDNSILAYRLQSLGVLANNISPQNSLPPGAKPKKQDAIMQTDPVQNEDDDTQPNNSYSEVSDKSYNSEEYNVQSYPKDYLKNESPYPRNESPYPRNESPYPNNESPYPKNESPYPKNESPYPKDLPQFREPFKDYGKEAFNKDYQRETPTFSRDNAYKDTSYSKESSYPKDQSESYPNKSFEQKNYEPKDYTKSSDYIPRTNDEYNKEAEKYALERKSHNGYDSAKSYQKIMDNGYQKLDLYSFDKYQREGYYQNGYTDSADVLRNQQHNLQMLQEQHRVTENQNFFNENHIKIEIDISGDDDKYAYDRNEEQLGGTVESNPAYAERRHQLLLDHLQTQMKQEPDTSSVCDTTGQSQGSPYFNGHNNTMPGFYEPLPRPGPELLIAKQNALAAHTQLWQNTMKRPFFYSDGSHYNSPHLHRYEDVSRLLQ